MRGCLLDTQDLEAITSLAVDKVLALDFDGGDSVGGGRKSASRGEQLSVCLYQTVSQQSNHSMVANCYYRYSTHREHFATSSGVTDIDS